ncbi:hypothetical protein GGI12_002735 [Dipsacomyces acuminosporus]|nr:hypothetical protein GGI12_002735 [Dipsacomyces acuminosporus]
MSSLSLVEQAKRSAAHAAVDKHVLPSVRVLGVGSGSTVVYAAERLLELKNLGKLNPALQCVPTSFQSKQLIVDAGLKAVELDDLPELDPALPGFASIDVTIDGADEVVPHTRPTLADAGYKFDMADGKLHSIETGEPYNFHKIRGSKSKRIELYQRLTDIASREVYAVLTSDEIQMEPIAVPNDREPHCSIYATKGALEARNLVVLVTGHSVRGGVWAWNVLVNDGLYAGSIIGYVKDCVERGFGVLALNPNENVVAPDGYAESFVSYPGKGQPIRGSEHTNEHVGYVWSHFIRGSKAENVVFVAYNTAGIAVVDLLRYDYERFANKVSGVAFIDTLHSTFPLKPKHVKWLELAGKNWVSSTQPAGEPVDIECVGCESVSACNAGDIRELTPFLCQKRVIEFAADCFARGQLAVALEAMAIADDKDACGNTGAEADAGDGSASDAANDSAVESVVYVDNLQDLKEGEYVGWD